MNGKQKVKDAIKGHTGERERFKAAIGGILDNAKGLIESDAPKEQQLGAIEELRGELDELFDDIQKKAK